MNYANQRRSSLPPTLLLPICSSTCEASQSSINSIINNPRSCQTPTSEQKRIRDLVQSELLLTCALSQSTVCFNGTTLERQSCGFSGPNALETAQLFCLNNSDSCCISLNSFPISTPQPTSGSRSMDAVAYVVDWTVIIAIVVGILLLILLCILGFAICIKRKNKNNEQQLPQHVIMPLSTQDGTHKRQLYRVRHSYQADMSDEMNLEIDHQGIYLIFKRLFEY